LRQIEGRLLVSWHQNKQQLALRWQELDGTAAMPQQQGFGSALIKNLVTRQLCVPFTLDWQERGLVADFVFPLAKLAQ
jgi:two-component sensor histidine kinase